MPAAPMALGRKWKGSRGLKYLPCQVSSKSVLIFDGCILAPQASPFFSIQFENRRSTSRTCFKGRKTWHFSNRCKSSCFLITRRLRNVCECSFFRFISIFGASHTFFKLQGKTTLGMGEGERKCSKLVVPLLSFPALSFASEPISEIFPVPCKSGVKGASSFFLMSTKSHFEMLFVSTSRT